MIHIVIAGVYPIAHALGSAMSQNCNPKVYGVSCGSEQNGVDTHDKDVLIWFRKEKIGAAQNYWQLIEQCVLPQARDEDIIAFLDGDDRLVSTTALEPVLKAYQDREVMITHGSYRKKSGNVFRFGGAYRSNDVFREEIWRATHLKTVRVKLWKHLPEYCMKEQDGVTWLKTCSDLAIMFPLLEMAGHDRIKYIQQEIYEYNDENPDNDHKIHGDQQALTETWLRQQPRFQRLENV
jgi:hypothetical protein